MTRLTVEGHRVSAAFEGAAVELQGSEVKLARVDVTEEKDLAKKLNFTGHPIKLYLSGDIHNPEACPGMCKKVFLNNIICTLQNYLGYFYKNKMCPTLQSKQMIVFLVWNDNRSVINWMSIICRKYLDLLS